MFQMKKRTVTANGRKWASYKKLWTKYKIASGKKDVVEMQKYANKLVKIAMGLKDSKGNKIKIPIFKELVING